MEMEKRVPWDQYFMSQAIVLSQRSTCRRLMVGATLVRDKRIISGGYNGSVSGEKHCMDHGCYMEDGHCIRTVHAEMNALVQCAKFGVPTEGSVIYVTHFPCLSCTKHLIQAGVKQINYLHDYHNHPYAVELLDQAGVETKQIKMPDNFFDNFNEFITNPKPQAPSTNEG